MPFVFEKLLVYQKSVTLADEVCRITARFPYNYRFLADQLNRAALSIAANIAEGNGRSTGRDRRYFFGITRGSVQECVPLLEIALRRQLLGAEDHLRLTIGLQEISRMLSGLIKSVEKRSPV